MNTLMAGEWYITMVTRMTIQLLVIQHHSNKKRERKVEGRKRSGVYRQTEELHVACVITDPPYRGTLISTTTKPYNQICIHVNSDIIR